MALRLEIDPTGVVSGAAQAESALDRIKKKAVETENAIVNTGKRGGAGLAPIVPGADKAEGALAEVRREADRTGAALSTVGNRGASAVSAIAAPVESAGRGFGRFGGIAQQAGYQIGDFAVQVGAGTSAIQAFGQQAPQLLGAFGAIGSVLGLIVAIAVPVGAALWNMSAAAAPLSDAMNDLADASDAYTGAVDRSKVSLAELRGEFGANAEQAYNLFQVMRDMAAFEFAEKLAEAGISLSESLSQMDHLISSMDGGGRSALQAAMMLGDQFGVTADEARRIQAAMDDLATANGPEEVAASARALLDAIKETADESGRIPDALRPAATTAAELAVEAYRLAGASGDAATGISQFGTNAASAQGPLGGLLGQAQGLATAAWSAANGILLYGQRQAEAAANAVMSPMGPGDLTPEGGFAPNLNRFGNPYIGEGGFAPSSSRRPPPRPDLVAGVDWGAPPKGKKGKGGKSAAQEAADDYERLMSSLDDVTRAENEYADAQDVVAEALKHKKITQDQANEALALSKKRMDEAISAANGYVDIWEIGGSAIDRLIDGTGKLRDVWKDVVKEIAAAMLQKSLMSSVTGATAGDSIGTLLAKGLFGGFFDTGGAIPMGGYGMVGERGPELVRSTSRGAVVTSRMDTAAMMRGGQQVVTGEIGVTVDDDGKMQAYVKRMGVQVANQARQAAVQDVRRNWSAWGNEYERHGQLT